MPLSSNNITFSKDSVESSTILRHLDEASQKIVRIISFFAINENSFFYHNTVLLNTSEEIYPVLNSQIFCNLNYSFPSSSIPIPTKHIESSNLIHIRTYICLLLGLSNDSRLSTILPEKKKPDSTTETLFNFLEPFKPLSKSVNKSKRSSLINNSSDFSSHKSSMLSPLSAQSSSSESKKSNTKKRFSSKFNLTNNSRDNTYKPNSNLSSSLAKTSLLKFSTSAVHQRMAILDLVDESNKQRDRKSVSSIHSPTQRPNSSDRKSTSSLHSPTQFANLDNSESFQSGFDDSSIFSNNAMESKEIMTLHSNNSSGSSNSLITSQTMFSGSGASSTHLKNCSYTNSIEFKYAIDAFLVYLKTYYKILKSLNILFSNYKFEDKNQATKDLKKSVLRLLTKLNCEVLNKFFSVVDEVSIAKIKSNFDHFFSEIADDSCIFSVDS